MSEFYSPWNTFLPVHKRRFQNTQEKIPWCSLDRIQPRQGDTLFSCEDTIYYNSLIIFSPFFCWFGSGLKSIFGS